MHWEHNICVYNPVATSQIQVTVEIIFMFSVDWHQRTYRLIFSISTRVPVLWMATQLGVKLHTKPTVREASQWNHQQHNYSDHVFQSSPPGKHYCNATAPSFLWYCLFLKAQGVLCWLSSCQSPPLLRLGLLLLMRGVGKCWHQLTLFVRRMKLLLPIPFTVFCLTSNQLFLKYRISIP